MNYKLVPVDQMTPEMITAVQTKTEIGEHIAADWTGAYNCFNDFWRTAVAAAPAVTNFVVDMMEIGLPQGYKNRPFDYTGYLYTEGQMRQHRESFARVAVSHAIGAPAAIDIKPHCQREMVNRIRDRIKLGNPAVPEYLRELVAGAVADELAYLKRKTGSYTDETKIGKALNALAENLPLGWLLNIEIEKGSGVLTLQDPDGKTYDDNDMDPGAVFYCRLQAALDIALDGGKKDDLL